MIAPQSVAISTRSSLASLPAMLAAARVLGIRDQVADVTLPMAVALFRATGPAMNSRCYSTSRTGSGMEPTQPDDRRDRGCRGDQLRRGQPAGRGQLHQLDRADRAWRSASRSRRWPCWSRSRWCRISSAPRQRHLDVAVTAAVDATPRRRSRTADDRRSSNRAADKRRSSRCRTIADGGHAPVERRMISDPDARTYQMATRGVPGLLITTPTPGPRRSAIWKKGKDNESVYHDGRAPDLGLC